MNKKTIDKKTALKLINKYADDYKRIEEEKAMLERKVKDLNINLNLNKQIIESFFKSSDSIDSKYNIYISKTKEESILLNNTIKDLESINSDLRMKLVQYESIVSEKINNNSEETKELSDMVFILENKLKKKDNIIKFLKNQLSKYENVINTGDYENFVNEVYIADPNETITILYNDLNLYKKAYDMTLMKIKENVNKIENLEQRLIDERNNKTSSSVFSTTTNAINEMILKCTKKDWETEEWLAILNYLNLTKEDISNNINKNKFITKMFDGIELINKILIVRNKNIAKLTKENNKLKEKIETLSNENTLLTKNIYLQQNGIFASKMEEHKNGYENNNNVSMLNNVSFEGLDNEEKIMNRFTNCQHFIRKNILEELNKKGRQIDIDKLNNSALLQNNFGGGPKINFGEHKIDKNLNFTQVSENSFYIGNSDIIENIKKM